MYTRPFHQIVVCACLLLAFLSPQKTVGAQGQSFIELPLEALNSQQPIEFHGVISSQTLNFPVSPNWLPDKDNWLEIQINASPLLDSAKSSFTILLNNQPILSYQVAAISAVKQHIRLPGNLFKQGNNSLTFTGTMYLPEDSQTNCQNWDDPSRWLAIVPGGILHLSFSKQDVQADLSNFPEAVFEPMGKYISANANRQTLVVLPENPTPDELTSLSTISYILGSYANATDTWQPEIVSPSQFSPNLAADRNIIFIGNTPADFQNQVGQDKDSVALFSSPWSVGNTVLILSDRNRQDGFSPAAIFNDPARESLLHGNVAYLDHQAPAPLPPFPNTYSLEDLGYLDRTVRGVGQQNLIYSLYIPYDVDPLIVKLNLALVYSPDLDLPNSSFTIYLNGFSIAGVRPSLQDTAGVPITISLPARKFRRGINFIRVSSDLHINHGTCERLLESVWLTVLNNSTIEMTYRNGVPIPSLKDFPLPFSGDRGSLFVIPNHFNTNDLSHVSQLSFMIGNAVYEPSQPPAAVTASDFEPKETTYHNVILIGLPAENSVIQSINDLLPQPFQPGQNSLKQGYGIYLPVPDQDASLGLMQIIPSPWIKSGTILVLTGNDLQGLDWTWDVALNTTLQKEFAGNVMVVGSPTRSTASGAMTVKGTPQAFFQQSADVSNIPWIGSFLQRNADSFLITELGAVGTALVLVIGILWAIRAAGKKNTPSLFIKEEKNKEP